MTMQGCRTIKLGFHNKCLVLHSAECLFWTLGSTGKLRPNRPARLHILQRITTTKLVNSNGSSCPDEQVRTGQVVYALWSLLSSSSVMHHSASGIMPACLAKLQWFPGWLVGAKTLHVSKSSTLFSHMPTLSTA